MHPILASFQIGGTEIVFRAYGTFMVLAWVIAVVLGTVVAWRRGLSWWRTLVVFVWALGVGVVGARLLDLAVNWNYYAEDTSRIYDVGFRGFALYGGLLVGTAVGVLVARALRLSLWRLADSAVPSLVAGIVLIRVGCLLNGCCFGTVTSLPWGVSFPPGSPAWGHQVVTGQIGLLELGAWSKPVHPTQIYEMIAAVVLGGLAAWLTLRKDREGRPRTPSGVPFLVFMLGFTAFRALNNGLRVRLVSMTLPGWFYPVLYGLICVGIAALLVWRMRRKDGLEAPRHP